MASFKPIAASSPVLLFVAMAVMLAACTAHARAPAPAPAPAARAATNSCPPGFENYLDLTDFARGTGRDVITVLIPGLLSAAQAIVQSIPHTGVKVCVCYDNQVNNITSPLLIGCVAY